MKLLLIVLALNVFAGEPAREETLGEVISFLTTSVEESGLVFIRNDKEHTSKEAAEHMLMKYNYLKKRIKTPEQFIKYCASKSSRTGKFYYLKMKDGTTVKSGDWLYDLLDKHRKR